jgi:hypothetical protein
MIWQFQCCDPKCGFLNIHMSYPFRHYPSGGEMIPCRRCHGDTRRVFDDYDEHDVQDDIATGGSKWLRSELQGHWEEDAKADRGYE